MKFNEPFLGMEIQAIEISQSSIYSKIDKYKKQIDAMRPLPVDVVGRIMQKFRLDWNYHSNSIEGNKLNYGETVAFLMHGLTAKGKPFKDHLDIRGHNAAIDYLMHIVNDGRGITELDIRELHKIILVQSYSVEALTSSGQATTKEIRLGEYKKLPNHVKTRTGEIHYYATPEETPSLMSDLISWLNIVRINSNIHPCVVSSLFHHRFVAIHPFDDGNGRMTRILMNLFLMQNSFPPVVIKQENRDAYYEALSQADAGDYEPFARHIADELVHSLEIYLKALIVSIFS